MNEKVFLLSMIQLKQEALLPLYQQVYNSLRQSIQQGQLRSGVKLPSSRDLASLLDVSRNTIVHAYQRLADEGYIEMRPNSGTYVMHDLPEEILKMHSIERVQQKVEQFMSEGLSARGKLLTTSSPTPLRFISSRYAFPDGMPALDKFPFDIWSRLHMKYYREPHLHLFDYSIHEPASYPPLVEAIAEHLNTARSVKCTPEQIAIVAGSQQALFMLAQMLLDAGDYAWMEEPGYPGARNAVLSAGAKLTPIPVDEDGINVGFGIKHVPHAKLVYITPSHQYPLGSTLSLARRLQLLKWAEEASAWILEDDFDSEYRYKGHPLPSLQGLDMAGRVIYIGTFSKVLFPNLRLGYVVLPSSLVESFHAVNRLVNLRVPLINQAVLSDFMKEGHYNRHVRRMRKLYWERIQIFSEHAAHDLEGLLTCKQSDAGMHFVGWLPPDAKAQLVSNYAAEQNIEVMPLSHYYVGTHSENGLLLGCTGTLPEHIPSGIMLLRKAIQKASLT